MKLKKVLHILRNPWGWSSVEIREAQIEACDLLEKNTRADEPVKKADYSYDDLVGMLEDVVNELDLSESMLEKHGPMGSPPAQMVREVLDKKDLHIRMLKQGFVDVGDKSKSEPVSVEDSALCQNCKTIGRNGEHSWYCRKCGEKL